jgi:hypothetical protein
MLAWVSTAEHPRKKLTADTIHVLGVAGEIPLEKLFFSANPFQDHEAKYGGRDQGQPGTDGQRAAWNREQHG